MQKIYKSQNGIIIVTLPKSLDRERLMSATEDFLRKVIIGGKQNGNSNQTRNFRKK